MMERILTPQYRAQRYRLLDDNVEELVNDLATACARADKILAEGNALAKGALDGTDRTKATEKRILQLANAFSDAHHERNALASNLRHHLDEIAMLDAGGCHNCRGTGKVDINRWPYGRKAPCRTCRGTGKIR